MNRLILVLSLWIAMTAGALAQTPEDTVRWIYKSMSQPGISQERGLWHLSRPERRAQFFSRRMVEFIIAQDSHGDDLATACIDFDPAIPGNDFDSAEVLRTLNLAMSGDASRSTVAATFTTFTTFSQPVRVEYDFIVEDGFWKIDDIAGPGFRISRIPCAPRQATAPTDSGMFCYANGPDTLRLNLLAGGAAQIDMQSWQSNGHSCSVNGRADTAEGGWMMQAEEGCRLFVLVTADQGIRFADPEQHCKRWMCGQRAVIDGLRFPRSSQIDCALMPRH